MGEPMTKSRLKNYIRLKKSVEIYEERLARLKNEEQIPAMRQSDGSKRGAGASDRMANAIVRRLAYEEKMQASMQRIAAEMDAIESAIDQLSDALEREVLRLRYIDGDGECGYMPWKDVALTLYGDYDERLEKAVLRLHGRALQSVGKVEV